MSRAPGTAGLDLGACRQPFGEALAVEPSIVRTERAYPYRGLRTDADFDTKAASIHTPERAADALEGPGREPARCLTSALGGPYPDTQVAGDLTSSVAAMPTR